MSWKLSEWRWRQDAGLLDGSFERRGNLQALRQRVRNDSRQEEIALPQSFAQEPVVVDVHRSVARSPDLDDSESFRRRATPANDLPLPSISSSLSLLTRSSISASPSQSSYARLLQRSESHKSVLPSSCASRRPLREQLEDAKAQLFAFHSPRNEVEQTPRDLLPSPDHSAQTSRQGTIHFLNLLTTFPSQTDFVGLAVTNRPLLDTIAIEIRIDENLFWPLHQSSEDSAERCECAHIPQAFVR